MKWFETNSLVYGYTHYCLLHHDINMLKPCRRGRVQCHIYLAFFGLTRRRTSYNLYRIFCTIFLGPSNHRYLNHHRTGPRLNRSLALFICAESPAVYLYPIMYIDNLQRMWIECNTPIFNRIVVTHCIFCRSCHIAGSRQNLQTKLQWFHYIWR